MSTLFIITGIKLAWYVISGDIVSARKENGKSLSIITVDQAYHPSICFNLAVL